MDIQISSGGNLLAFMLFRWSGGEAAESRLHIINRVYSASAQTRSPGPATQRAPGRARRRREGTP